MASPEIRKKETRQVLNSFLALTACGFPQGPTVFKRWTHVLVQCQKMANIMLNRATQW